MNGQRLLGPLAGQLDVAQRDMDLGHAPQIGSPFQLEAELLIDLLRIGVQPKGAPQVACIPVDLRKGFEVTGFFLPQSLLSRLL